MGRAAVWVAVAVAVLVVIHQVLLGVLVGVLFVVAYFASLPAVPVIRCPKCEGSDVRRPFPWNLLFPHAFTLGCRSKWCNGGAKVRLGVRLFAPARARELMGK